MAQSFLTLEERRDLGKAAKSLTRIVLVSATKSYDIQYQNLHAFLRGRNDGLSEEKQIAMLKMFGFSASGQLLKKTHAWAIKAQESLNVVAQQLKHDSFVSIRLQEAYTSSRTGNEIGVGVFMSLQRKQDSDPCKVILTVAPVVNDVLPNLQVLLKALPSKPELICGDRLHVKADAARFIWRQPSGPVWIATKTLNVKRSELLPYNQDIVGIEATYESPTQVLGDMHARFEALVDENASLKGSSRIAPQDTALLKRSKQILYGS